MKIHFDKKEDGEVTVQIEGADFTTKDYIRMIKVLKGKGKIEALYNEKITDEEKLNINEMIVEINNIPNENTIVKSDNRDEGFEDSDELPF